MGESVGRDPEVAKAERALSDELAELADAETESSGELVEAFSSIGVKIVKAIEGGLVSAGQGARDIRDGLKDIRVGLGEKLDEVVGFVVDPIRKGLSALGDKLKGFDWVMGVGFIVGAVVALKDDIKKGWEWLGNNWKVVLEKGWDLLLRGLDKGWELLKVLWPHIRDGLIILGETVRFALDKGWKYIKDDVAPWIVDKFVNIGTAIWDLVPDWLKTGLKAIRSVVVTIMSLSSKFQAFILHGLEDVFRSIGLDTLADVLGYVGDVLSALADWLPGGPKVQTKEERAVQARGTTKASIAASGSEQAERMFEQARGAGLSEMQASGLAGMALEDETKANVMMQAFRAAIKGGMTAREALQAANKAAVGGGIGASARSLGSADAGAGIEGAVSDRVATIAVAREVNATLKKSVMLQEQALSEQRRAAGRSTPDVIDTISSADPLGLYGGGKMAGGMA